MTVTDAILLGTLQGLTEFLPISSSGHIELGRVALGIEEGNNLPFQIIIHTATVLSTLVAFRKDVWQLTKGLFALKLNEETRFIFLVIVSTIPVGLVGLYYQDDVESLFGGRTVFIGSMLLITSALLFVTRYARTGGGKLNLWRVIVIGAAQAVAVIPGISRSGSTIATALLLKVDPASAARFSFLMVIPPILGAAILEADDIAAAGLQGNADSWAYGAGFLTAFAVGLASCRWMVSVVKRGKMAWFSIYCLLAGTLTVILGLV